MSGAVVGLPVWPAARANQPDELTARCTIGRHQPASYREPRMVARPRYRRAARSLITQASTTSAAPASVTTAGAWPQNSASKVIDQIMPV